MALQWSDVYLEAALEGMVTAMNAAAGTAPTIEFFDGTLPALTTDPDDGTLICSAAFGADTFDLATGPLRILATNTPVGFVSAAGTITYFRVKDDSSVVIMQGTCGSGSGDIDITPTNVTDGSALLSVGQFNFSPITVTF